MDDNSLRADVALAARGLAPSREKARVLIDEGLVTLNGASLSKPSRRVADTDVLRVTGQDHPYVSRGGLKLEKALLSFGVAVAGAVCLDVGASTGGFTDVLLQNGARLVYAVDVGTGQLHPRLLADSRVVSMEKVNARALSRGMFPEPPSLAVMDVSFISIRLILPSLFETLGPDGRIVTLIKPQFEAGREAVGKRGIVSGPDNHRRVLRQIVDFVPAMGWRVRALDFSPIAGGDGNLEFLADIVPAPRCDRLLSDQDIKNTVADAHKAL